MKLKKILLIAGVVLGVAASFFILRDLKSRSSRGKGL